MDFLTHAVENGNINGINGNILAPEYIVLFIKFYDIIPEIPVGGKNIRQAEFSGKGPGHGGFQSGQTKYPGFDAGHRGGY